MNNIKIRDFEKKDYEELLELWDDVGLATPRRNDNLETILRSLKMGGRLFVAEAPCREIVAAAWVTFDGRRLHFHHLGVRSDYRRKGLGRMMTSHCIQFAKEKGYQIKLEVHRENIPAVKLFTGMGFGYLGDYDVYIIRDFSNF